jgi:lipopolysaccharide biosynthesis glycosyltransferase
MDQVLLYSCVGKNEDYVNLLELFCESLCVTNPHVVKNLLIIGDISFHNRIHDILSKYAMMNYYILDTPDSFTSEQASMNKLKIFDFPHIRKFQIALYVDLDCLFLGNLNFIFESPIEDNKLYAYAERESVEENKLCYYCLSDDSGKYVYYNHEDKEFLQKHSKLPFNAGLFMFRISDTMKRHFDTLNEFVHTHKGKFFFEQGYMNTYFHLTNVSDTSFFTKRNVMMLERNSVSEVSLGIHKIVHFILTGAGTPTAKYAAMSTFWEEHKSKFKHSGISIYPLRKDMIDALIPHYANVLEIGVFKGHFSEELASRIPQTLHLVDMWEEKPMSSGDKDGNNVEVIPDASTLFKSVSHRFRFNKNIKIHRMRSSDFLKLMKPNSLDVAYLDGDHSYEGVKADLEAVLPCVRKHGWIMGHDYEMNMEKARTRYEFGVKRAVDEFCMKYNYSIHAKGMDGCVSYAICIDKK